MPNHGSGGVGVECCAPTGCLLACDEPQHRVLVDDNLHDAVRSVCSNEHCTLSGLMHRACFDNWESQVLQFLRSCGGRARQWTERQRQQNLWTKKGYDLAFKACSCLCGRGHLRKDTDWTAPKKPPSPVAVEPAGGQSNAAGSGGGGGGGGGGRRRRNKNSTSSNGSVSAAPVKLAASSAAARPAPVKSLGSSSGAGNNTTSAAQLIMLNQQQQQMIRQRANSLSSTGSTASSSGASSPPEVGSMSSSAGTTSGSGSQFVFLSSPHHHHQSAAVASAAVATNKRRTVTIKADDRDRRSSGNSGLFLHRADYSSFNVLPRHKVNSFHIKMEDEGSYGNDDIRCFILSNLAMARMSKTYCVICQSAMQIYDRYPLIDGTFFLSPKQYSKACIPVTAEGRQQHLCAVCMSCLEGWTCRLRCRSCRSPWDGSALILGTMYSYDVFAAVPCCPDRLRCNQCNNLVIQPTHRFQYFSQYSRDISCPHCTSHQHHFVKSLPQVYQLFRSNGSASGSPTPSSSSSSSSSSIGSANAPVPAPFGHQQHHHQQQHHHRNGAIVQPEPLSVASALQALASLNFS